jgi:Protein of unknown function (DUF3015)
MKKLLIGALIASSALIGTTQEKSAVAGNYGTAGCGLGSIVFGSKPGYIQILAATTNGTFASQTFGITSGTSNCADTGGGTPSAAAFIQTNREALAKDISRGNGETIKNLATLSGCVDTAAVGATLQKNFKVIFPTAEISNTEVSTNVLTVLKSEKSLSCQRLI